MFTRFDENPAMTLRVIKETKRYGRTEVRTHGRMDNVKTVYPPQTKFAGGTTTNKVCGGYNKIVYEHQKTVKQFGSRSDMFSA